MRFQPSTLSVLANVMTAWARMSSVLVVAPASVAPNWVREAKRFVPGLRALFHHGNDRHALDRTGIDLVVTT